MPVLNSYVVGDLPTVQGTWTNKATGTPLDPTDARLDVLDPTGVLTTYTYALGQLTKASTGVYTRNLDTTGKAGRWEYRFWSPPGLAQTASAGAFMVTPWPVTGN